MLTRAYVNKKRPASSSYGMLTGSLICGLSLLSSMNLFTGAFTGAFTGSFLPDSLFTSKVVHSSNLSEYRFYE